MIKQRTEESVALKLFEPTLRDKAIAVLIEKRHDADLQQALTTQLSGLIEGSLRHIERFGVTGIPTFKTDAAELIMDFVVATMRDPSKMLMALRYP